jgi:hypothetical protein
MFFLKRGVPSKNGVRRRCIIDHVISSRSYSTSPKELSVHHTEDSIDLESSIPFTLGKFFCGEARDEFRVSLRFVQRCNPERVHQTGYRSMYEAVSASYYTSTCDHFPALGTGSETQANYRMPDYVCATSLHFADGCDIYDGENNLTVVLTANNPTARWVALIETWFHERPVLLRTKSCCCLCAIEQARHVPPRRSLHSWVLIL